jgi:hypothetical protein
VNTVPFGPQPPETLSPLTAGVLSDGSLQIWGAGPSGLWSTWKETNDANSAWHKWSLFQSLDSTIPYNPVTALAAGRLPNGRLQLWASVQEAEPLNLWRIYTCWKSGVGPTSPWTQWQQFSDTEQFIDTGMQSFAVAPLSDGRLQLWGVTGNWALVSTWKETADPSSDWVPWSSFPSP